MSVFPLLRLRRLGARGLCALLLGPAGASGGSGCGRPSSAPVGFWVFAFRAFAHVRQPWPSFASQLVRVLRSEFDSSSPTLVAVMFARWRGLAFRA